MDRTAFRPSFWTWTLAALCFALLLRVPWFGAPLGNDEGGLTYIAAHWHLGGPYLYGHTFIDRPPLLLAIFRIAAEAGGVVPVRLIGAGAVALLVLVAARLGREVGCTRAGIWAGAIAAVLGSSSFLGSVFTPAELLAVLPSGASVLLLLIAGRRAERRHLLLFAAGLLAAAALLVKQSFGDALVAGIVFFLASAHLDREHRRSWLAAAAAYSAGVALAGVCLDAWEVIGGVPDGATSYALFGFRLQGLSALAGSSGGLPGRFADRLALPLLGSGLGVILLWAPVGLRALSERRVVQLTIAGWGGAGIVGVLLGGSYWPHYLIELIPAASVCAGLALATARRVLVVITAATLAASALAGSLLGPAASEGLRAARQAQAVGVAVAERARPGDTIYVRYSEPNIAYYSGLRNPFPYDWSLMLRTVPDAERELRSLLRSPRRPSWVVGWEPTTAYDMDRGGVTGRLLRRHYRPVGEVEGTRLLLERGLRRPGAARDSGPGIAPEGAARQLG